MFDIDYVTKEDIKVHNPNWTKIPDHLYRIIIVEGSGSGKTNILLPLTKIINHILIKFIYMKKIIHMKQNINY